MNQIIIETSAGQVVAELYPDAAPLTVEFIKNLIALGHYDGGDIYRATQLDVDSGPFLLQGGAALPFLQGAKVAGKAPMLEPIESTGTTGLHHRRGTLSLARDLDRTGHALAEFFICLGDFPSLDEKGRDLLDTQGFPAFGQVILGLDLLDEIAARETQGHTHLPRLKDQMLTAAVSIQRIYAID